MLIEYSKVAVVRNLSKMLVVLMLCAVLPLASATIAACRKVHERLGTLIEQAVNQSAVPVQFVPERRHVLIVLSNEVERPA